MSTWISLTASAAEILHKDIYHGLDPERAFELMMEEDRLEHVKAFLPANLHLLEYIINYLDQTPLLVAAHRGNFPMVAYLLELGALPGATDFLGRNSAFFLSHWPKDAVHHLNLDQPSANPDPAVVSAALVSKKHLKDEEPDPLYDCYLTQGDIASAKGRLRGKRVGCDLCRVACESIWVTATWRCEVCSQCYQKDVESMYSAHTWYNITELSVR